MADINPAYDSVRFYKDQLTAPPESSKKWMLVKRGMQGVMIMFGTAAVMLMIRPSIGDHLTSLSTIAITSWCGLVAVGCGSIAAVDFKNSAALESTIKTVTVNDSEKIESNQALPQVVTRSNYYGDLYES